MEACCTTACGRNRLSLVVYPATYRTWYFKHPRWLAGFLESTVGILVDFQMISPLFWNTFVFLKQRCSCSTSRATWFQWQDRWHVAQRQFWPIDFGDLALHTAGTYQKMPVPTVCDVYIVKKGVKEVKRYFEDMFWGCRQKKKACYLSFGCLQRVDVLSWNLASLWQLKLHFGVKESI